MDFPTIVATATAVVWVARNQQRLIPIYRTTLRDCIQAGRLFIYRSIYLPYRSEISLLLGWLLFYQTFDCDCCCLHLGGQDLDSGYKACCGCDAAADVKYCFTCVSTYVETQVTERQAIKTMCMASRQCELDDRLVRKRLSPAAVKILDRNQIIQAAAALANERNGRTTEKLWHCPSPDCAYAGFISNRTNRHPESPSVFNSLTRLFRSKPRRDPRSIRCPGCLITSCQFCANVWTKGTADHEGITCEKYTAQLSTDDSQALATWKSQARVQVCRHCHNTIEKNEGCKHMTCRCGYQFCWVCGEEWSDQHSLFFCQPAPTGGGSSNLQRIATWLGSWLQPP
jgi:IBR domain, a half RING-finger domain